MRRALFLDRDGIINRDHGYVHQRERFDFLPGIFDLAHAAVVRDFLVIVVTNQSGIARGYYTTEDFERLMSWVSEEFRTRGAALHDVLHCADHPARASDRRKPGPGMLLEAAALHGLDLPSSIIVGDKATDMEAGFRAGVGQRVLVTEDAAEAARAPAATMVLPDVQSVAEWFSRPALERVDRAG